MFTPAEVNLDRLLGEIETLSQFGKQASGGIVRYTFSEEHQQAVNHVADWMNAAGLEVRFDQWGSLYGRMPGYDNAQCVMSGSHLDSVPHGGNYDGPLGVLSALEATRLILEHDIIISKPIEVVSFIEEEGARFPGLLGSKLGTGQLSDDKIVALQDRHGERYLDALAAVDFPYPVDPTHDLTQQVESYIELHIEQGRRLENAGIPIGVITTIASPNFMGVKLMGRSDHAGATEYTDRHDTLLATAEIITGVREVGTKQFAGKGHMTVGYINAYPNVVNVVAGQTEFSIDFRAASDEIAVEMKATAKGLINAACAKHDLEGETTRWEHVSATISPQHIRNAISNGAQQATVDARELVSWAAHDAMVMATVCDIGMIFVPCKDGRSHTPEEYTKPEDIAAGVATLANTLITLAQ